MAGNDWPPLPWPWETWQEFILEKERYLSRFIQRAEVRLPVDWVLQDIWDEMWSSWSQFVGPWAPATYLARTTKDIISRYKRGHLPISLDALEEAAGPVEAPGGGSPEEEAESRELQAHVRAILRLLPKGQREVLTLHHLQGLSFKEIARLKRRSVNGVKSAAAKGMRTLREMETTRLASGHPPLNRKRPAFEAGFVELGCLHCALFRSNCLASLPGREQWITRLHFLEGTSIEALAESLLLGRAGVTRLLRTGLRILRINCRNLRE